MSLSVKVCLFSLILLPIHLTLCILRRRRLITVSNQNRSTFKHYFSYFLILSSSLHHSWQILRDYSSLSIFYTFIYLSSIVHRIPLHLTKKFINSQIVYQYKDDRSFHCGDCISSSNQKDIY